MFESIMTFMLGPDGISSAVAVLPIIMAAISAASAIGGGVASSRQNRKNQQLLDARNDELLMEQYQGVLDDPGSRAYLNTLSENLRDSITGIENSAVATGATHENTLASKESANKVVSDAMAGLLQREDAKRQGIIQQRNQLAGQQAGLNMQNAQNWASVAGNVASAASNLGMAYMSNNAKLFGGGGSSGATRASLSGLGSDAHQNLMSGLYNNLDNNISPSFISDMEKFKLLNV